MQCCVLWLALSKLMAQGKVKLIQILARPLEGAEGGGIRLRQNVKKKGDKDKLKT